MLRHMLKKQCRVMWVWGPVTQFSLNLEGIDSARVGGGDIMELIARIGANPTTTTVSEWLPDHRKGGGLSPRRVGAPVPLLLMDRSAESTPALASFGGPFLLFRCCWMSS